MSGKWIAIFVVLILVVGAAAAYGGYTTGVKNGTAQALTARNNFLAARGFGGAAGAAGGSFAGGGFGGGQANFGGQAGANGQNGGRQFNADNFASGQVKSIDGNTIELSTATDVLKVQTNDKTQIQKMATGSVSDIQQGERITIQGTRNADGTFTAQSIQIGRQGGFPGGGGSGGRNAGRSPAVAGAGTPQAQSNSQ